MKKILFILIGIIITQASLADERCDIWLETAQSVMAARQKGVSITNLMALVDKNDDGTVKVAINVDAIKKMIVDAYNSPLKSSDQERKELMVEFGNKYYLVCFNDT
ncbi:hypothetical protein VQ643_09920 [Pseudomonas sp. F1_0610]|uniref:hypothetical protein n=1 Tax=Pseudomonas sp. F1_0610 TaxID=3114284 RepID=UPI0039C2244A